VINFEEFSKIELKIAKILEAERVEGSEKLIKLKVDAGDPEIRQIVAGIGKAYEPESLVGKQITIVANLEPRLLMGLESQGMLLAAASDNGPVLLVPDKEVFPGSKIK
jgi:methionine--tRNA ligase beta chain